MIGAPRPWVLKVGGRELVPGPALAELALRVAEAVRSGRRVVVVHGGGDEVTERAAELGLPTEKVDGQRVTSDAMLSVVAEVLAGRVNLRLVNALEGAGVPAVGVTGVSGQLLRVAPAGDPPGRLGWVGEPRATRPQLLGHLLDDGWTPVVAPLGTDGAGGVYNVNADLAAASIAAALGADLLLLTDVPAVRDRQGRSLAALDPTGVQRLIDAGDARDGMIPKLSAAVASIVGGAASAWIGDLAGVGPEGPRSSSGTRVTRTAVRPGPPARRSAPSMGDS